jgi:hypothetical protein
VAKYTVNAAKLDTNLSMSKGSHRITVKAWDSSGVTYSKSLTITVN